MHGGGIDDDQLACFVTLRTVEAEREDDAITRRPALHRPKELDSTVIQLTRLRHAEVFLLNPDLFERVDSYVDTVVRLTNGNEYVVSESAAEIIERIVLFRAGVLAAGFSMQENSANSPRSDDTTHATLVRGALGPAEHPAAELQPFGPPDNGQSKTSDEVHQR
jgi:flagellar protein FlbD